MEFSDNPKHPHHPLLAKILYDIQHLFLHMLLMQELLYAVSYTHLDVYKRQTITSPLVPINFAYLEVSAVKPHMVKLIVVPSVIFRLTT